MKEAGQQQFEAVTPSDKAGNVAAPCLPRSTSPTTRKYCPLTLSPEACRAEARAPRGVRFYLAGQSVQGASDPSRVLSRWGAKASSR